MALAAACLMLAFVIAACGGSDDKGAGVATVGTTPAVQRTPETMLGLIERLPGGTPVPDDLRTLRSIRCGGGKVIIATDRETLTGILACTSMPPDDVLQQFVGQQVAIAYSATRLKLESVTAGTLELAARMTSASQALPVERATVGPPDAP